MHTLPLTLAAAVVHSLWQLSAASFKKMSIIVAFSTAVHSSTSLRNRFIVISCEFVILADLKVSKNVEWAIFHVIKYLYDKPVRGSAHENQIKKNFSGQHFLVLNFEFSWSRIGVSQKRDSKTWKNIFNVRVSREKFPAIFKLLHHCCVARCVRSYISSTVIGLNKCSRENNWANKAEKMFVGVFIFFFSISKAQRRFSSV